jgi:hypothetical protein
MMDIQEQLMAAILSADLPGSSMVKEVWVGVVWDSPTKFVAKAKMMFGKGHGKRTRDYSAHGDTISDALLELAAKIIIKYPVEDGESLDINLPVIDLAHTKTFRKWFSMDKKGEDCV